MGFQGLDLLLIRGVGNDDTMDRSVSKIPLSSGVEHYGQRDTDDDNNGNDDSDAFGLGHESYSNSQMKSLAIGGQRRSDRLVDATEGASALGAHIECIRRRD
jgi:hypothetical protein